MDMECLPNYFGSPQILLYPELVFYSLFQIYHENKNLYSLKISPMPYSLAMGLIAFPRKCQ